MSKKQAIAFFEEISKNQQLAQEVEKVVGGKNSDEEKAKELISLAKKHNFIFTQEDAKSAQDVLKKPLSLEEMLEVSGGKLNLKSSLMAAAMLLGLGAGGAALHNMEASAMDGEDHSTSEIHRQFRKKKEIQQLREKDEAIKPKPTKERKACPYVEHDKKVAERFKDVGVNDWQFWAAVRGLAGNGYLPNEIWPAVPQFEQTGDGKQNCRYCNAELTTGNDPFCKKPDCIFPWTFRQASAKRQTSQRPVNAKSCVRWALLPVLILDSRYTRITSTDVGEHRTARKLPIETPAEAWAVWQLLSQRGPVVNGVGRWPAIVEMMDAYDVEPAVQSEVIQLLEESYNNLVQGNDHLRAIGLGSEVQQLVEDHNNGWQNFIGAMVERGYGSEEVKEAVTKMINSYHMLTDEQLQQVDYDPTGIRRDATTASAEIEAAHQRFEIAMQEDARRHGEARRQAKVTVQQVIEKLQCGDKLSKEEAKAIAPMLKCSSKTCGNIGAKVQNTKGHIYFYCKSCNARIDDLLAMLPDAAPGNAPAAMLQSEQDESSIQIETRERPDSARRPSFPRLGEIAQQRPGKRQLDEDQDLEQQQTLVNPDQFRLDYDDQYGDFPQSEGRNEIQEKSQADLLWPLGYQPDFMQPSMPPENWQLDFDASQGNPFPMAPWAVNEIIVLQEPLSGQIQGMEQMNEIQQQLPSEQPIWQTYNGSENQLYMNPMNGQPQAMQNMGQINTQFAQIQQTINEHPEQMATQPQQNLIQQPMLNLDLQNDPVGDYINALNADTQELAQCTNMLKAFADNPLFANAETIRIVASAAHAVVNRVRQRELADSANQIILNALGADPRYETAAQAFSMQLERFNNVFSFISAYLGE